MILDIDPAGLHRWVREVVRAIVVTRDDGTPWTSLHPLDAADAEPWPSPAQPGDD